MFQSASPQSNNSRPSFDDILRQRVIEPLQAIVPASVHPNSITAITPFLAISSFALAVAAPSQTLGTALLFRLLAAVLMVASMLTDHVDGLHARRTQQTSKLGEALDHWFDALHVPLGAGGLAVTLGGHGWLVASVVITAGGVYNSQLILYHDTKKFVYPPTGSAWVQVLLAMTYAVSGLLLCFGPMENSTFLLLIELFLWAVVIGQAWNVLFYWRRLGARTAVAVIFFLLSYAFVQPLTTLHMPAWFLAVFLCLVSLVLSGSWILCAITDKTCGGIGFAVPVVLFFMLGTTLFPEHLPASLLKWSPWALSGMLIAAALVEFVQRIRSAESG